jgi:hypothetical protein
LAKIDRVKKAMSSAAMTREAAATLVRWAEVRTGSRMLAYEFIASNVGRSVAWVRALISQGLERVDADVGRAIDALLVRELQADIARATHEMEMARQRGDRPDSDEIIQAHTLIAQAQALLERRPL